MHVKKKKSNPKSQTHRGGEQEKKKSRRGNVHQVLASGSSMAGSTLRRFTFRMNP